MCLFYGSWMKNYAPKGHIAKQKVLLLTAGLFYLLNPINLTNQGSDN